MSKPRDWDKARLRITMPDGSRWDVPVMLIARNRAANYAGEFGCDIERSLKEDTLPLFGEVPYEVHDWAANNMNSSDVKNWAVRVVDLPRKEPDYQEGWMNGKYELVGGL